MFQNASIDIAIGLVLMYLVLSLMCTVINEFVATKLKLRSKSLAAGRDGVSALAGRTILVRHAVEIHERAGIRRQAGTSDLRDVV
jgi:hypothetical protein